MQKILHIFVLLLFLIFTSYTYSYDISNLTTTTEQTYSCDSNQEKENTSCCDDEESQDDCKDICKDSNCNCKTSISFFVPLPNSEYKLETDFNFITINWTYIQNAPKQVWLSIWQPPKIG